MIAKSKGQVKAYGPGNVNNLLNFGSLYYSITDVSRSTPTYFVIHFLNHKVRVKSVKTVVNTDVYPEEWKLSISNDNKKYTTLIEGRNSLCSDANKTPFYDGYICKIKETVRTYVTMNNSLTGNYVRFDLIKNTYSFSFNPIKEINCL